MNAENEPGSFEAEPPGSAPRFAVEPYHPDGGCPVVGTAALFVTTVLAGAISGWLVNRLIGAIGICLCCASGPVQLALLGFAIGTVGSVAVVLGKVRAPHVAGMAGVVGMLASVFGQLFSEYQQVLAAAQANAAAAGAAAPRLTFGEYLEQLQFFQLIYLGIGFVIGSGSCYPVMAAVASRPFDPVAEQWKEKHTLGRLQANVYAARRIVGSGEIVRLAEYPVSPDKGDVELSAYVSPQGAPQATVELELDEILRDPKGKTEQRTRVGMWTYPGEAWEVLDYLFPGAIRVSHAEHDAGDGYQPEME